MCEASTRATSSGVPVATTSPPASPPSRTEVDDVVGGPDHVEVVLDDDDRVPGVDEAVQDVQKLLHVGEVEPRRRLVQDVQRLSGRPLAQLARQLDPLRLAARERRGGLAEPDVAEPHVPQRVHAARDRRDRERSTRTPRRPSCRARRRWTFPCRSRAASRCCSGGPCRPRTARTRRGGSASRSGSGRPPCTPRSGRP